MQNRVVTPGQIIKAEIFLLEGGTLNYTYGDLIKHQILTVLMKQVCSCVAFVMLTHPNPGGALMTKNLVFLVFLMYYNLHL